MATTTIAKDETWRDKLVRRIKEEPLVPLGALVTTFTLVMAATKVGKKGQSKSMNRWLRARVIAQGATVAAIVGGSYVYGNSQQQKDARAQAAVASAEELRLKERQEFEGRLRAAEETHAIEEQAKTAAADQSGSGFWSKLGWTGAAKDASVSSTQTGQPSTSTSALSTPLKSASTASTTSTPATSSSTSSSAAPSENPATQNTRRSWFSWGSSKN